MLEETAFEAGVRVQIHSQAEPPFVHELGFGVAPGFQTFVATQEQRVSELWPFLRPAFISHCHHYVFVLIIFISFIPGINIHRVILSQELGASSGIQTTFESSQKQMPPHLIGSVNANASWCITQQQRTTESPNQNKITQINECDRFIHINVFRLLIAPRLYSVSHAMFVFRQTPQSAQS